MATILDGVEERHEGPEPRVLTEDVQRILKNKIKPGEDDGGESVSIIAENSDISTRTVYRVLQGDRKSLGLDLADRLCLAAGAHLAHCRLVWPDETITPYLVE
jgi:DNA invertase Pin-like site-specific DNA recombinase